MTNAIGPCRHFLLCDRPAAGWVSNPVLGPVPSCARCAERLGMQLLTARQVGTFAAGDVSWDVSSDELGPLGNFVADCREDAVAEAMAGLL